jgi:hypothetical protein
LKLQSQIFTCSKLDFAPIVDAERARLVVIGEDHLEIGFTSAPYFSISGSTLYGPRRPHGSHTSVSVGLANVGQG